MPGAVSLRCFYEFKIIFSVIVLFALEHLLLLELDDSVQKLNKITIRHEVRDHL